MPIHTLTALAIRVTGIVILIKAIELGASYQAMGMPSPGWAWATVAVMAAAALSMILFPLALAGRLLPAGGTRDTLDTDPPVGGGAIERLAASVIGLYFLVVAVTDGSYYVLLAAATQSFGGPPIWNNHQIASAGTTVLEFVFALWLLFGARQLVTLMRWARTAHTGS